jgi:hypothetical protein
MENNITFPIKIDEFIFYENRFTSKGVLYDYSAIESLKFFILNTSINFSNEERFNFLMRANDGSIFSLSIADAAFSFNQKKVLAKKQSLLKIYQYINELTFQRRINKYLYQLDSENFFDYKFLDTSILKTKLKTVKFSVDGNVFADGRVINLKKAKHEGTLKFGTAYGFGCDRSIDPYEISINEKKPIFGGYAEGTGSIRIDGGWDYPFLFEILKSIS